MNKKILGPIAVAAAISIAGLTCSDTTSPVSVEQQQVEDVACISTSTALISTNQLFFTKNKKAFVIVDVRSAAEYSAGHIHHSINIPFEVPFSLWITMVNDLLLEVPDMTQLTADLGKNGINRNSRVVLVTSLPTESNPYALAAPTRAALTLAYAGVKDIRILDGGFDKWVAEKKPVTTKQPVVRTVTFHGKNTADLFVDMNQVNANLGKMILVDARDAEVYSGQVIEPFANKAGHIPTAVSLPAPLLWNSDGTYKSRAQLQSIANTVIGRARHHKEVVIYCGVGGYASSVWYALTRILDYRNVKVYDGSAQEWVQTYDMEM